MADFNEDTLNQMADDAVNSASAPPLLARPTEPVQAAPQEAPAAISPLSSLTSLDDSQISQLVQRSYLTPAQAEQIVASRTAAQQPAVMSNQKLGFNPQVNPQAIQDLNQAEATQQALQGVEATVPQQNEMALDRVNSFMQGTGLEQPSQRPTPLMPAEPTQQMQQAAAQVAEREAAERQMAAELAEAKARHAANIDKAAADKVASLNQAQSGKDWGSIVGQGLAVALGELGRHMTGGGENLAIKTIERLTNERAAKEKLNVEQKLAAQKTALDVAQLKLNEEKLKTDSQLKRAQIGKIAMDMQKAAQEVNMKQNVMARLGNGQGFTAEELQILPEKDRSRAVIMPDGSYKLAVSTQRAKDASTASDAASQASGQIKELLAAVDYFGNNPAKKLVDRGEIAKAQSTQQALRGNLRTLIVGPGNVSTYEHELLNKVVRDPTELFSFASANRAALQQLLHKTQAAQRRALKSAGISVAPSINDINIQKLRQAAPNMTEKQAEDTLIKTGQWRSEE